jgi:signal transduction histidine kinase
LGLSLVAAVAHFHNAELVLEDNVPTGLRAALRFPRTVIRSLPGATIKSAAE